MRPFSEEEWKLAIRLAKDTRTAYKSHSISERELRIRFDHIRSIVHHRPMTDSHFEWLLEGLK